MDAGPPDLYVDFLLLFPFIQFLLCLGPFAINKNIKKRRHIARVGMTLVLLTLPLVVRREL